MLVDVYLFKKSDTKIRDRFAIRKITWQFCKIGCDVICGEI